MNVDLPNLQSITSEGESFVFPRCVTLESIMKLPQYKVIDIPMAKEIKLYRAFKNVQNTSIISKEFYYFCYSQMRLTYT